MEDHTDSLRRARRARECALALFRDPRVAGMVGENHTNNLVDATECYILEYFNREGGGSETGFTITCGPGQQGRSSMKIEPLRALPNPAPAAVTEPPEHHHEYGSGACPHPDCCKKFEPSADELRHTVLRTVARRLADGLGHMESCGSCAQDSWDICEGGRAAKKALDD